MSLAQIRSKTLVMAGVIVGLLVLLFLTRLPGDTPSAHAQTQGGAMAVDCDASTGGVQTSCQYDFGATFMIQIHVTEAPAGNYFGVQAKPRWDAGVLTYLPTTIVADEALWPSCGFSARADNQPGDPSVLYGCVPGIGDPALLNGSDFVGAVLQFEFQCVDASAPGGMSPPAGLSPPGGTGGVTSPLELVPRAGDPQAGTHMLDSLGDRIEPALSDASVTCGPPTGPGTPGPDTPGPGTPGAGTVGPTALPSTGVEPLDTGSGASARVWVIIGLLLVAGTAGLGVYGWRHIRAGRIG